ncbi:MAG: chromosomal replication initiator protein DnaA [Anaerolineae bacterium]|nr:chromosomal replication initiator protein DnaA [Anaerolineae bacterium]
MKAQEAWNIAYQQLELQLDRANFETWLRGAVFLRMDNEVYVIGVRNTYARDMLQHRLYRTIWRVLTDVCGRSAEIRFEVSKPAPKPAPPLETDAPLLRLLAEHQNQAAAVATSPKPSSLHAHISRTERTAIPESELNPRFTFDRYIVSASNRMAYEGARAVVEHPGRNYNPFMIYGGVGLGKTHLLQAIAHTCKAKNLRVVYVPSEAFINDLVDSIRQRTTAMFREKYRSVDVLLMDDVQFIAGKDSTQEEFFHTFNALYTFNKQIVIVSDRPPSQLTTLDDRLRSRFEGGLMVDIAPIEFETRVAILKMWAQERQIHIDPAVIALIAERARQNVRELEGVFNQMVAKTQLNRQPLTLDSAANALQRFEAPRPHGKQIAISDVIRAAAQHYEVKVSDLTGKGRTQPINYARQVAMYLARELTDSSLPQIGQAFGGRTHTTVLHGCNKITEQVTHDTLLATEIRDIRRQLIGGD